jgi:hypothetical protein
MNAIGRANGGLRQAVRLARCDPRAFYIGAVKARLPRFTEIYAGRPGCEPENCFLEFFHAAIAAEESRQERRLPLKWFKDMARVSSVLIRFDWLERRYGPSAVEEARKLLSEFYKERVSAHPRKPRMSRGHRDRPRQESR